MCAVRLDGECRSLGVPCDLVVVGPVSTEETIVLVILLRWFLTLEPLLDDDK